MDSDRSGAASEVTVERMLGGWTQPWAERLGRWGKQGPWELGDGVALQLAHVVEEGDVMAGPRLEIEAVFDIEAAGDVATRGGDLNGPPDAMHAQLSDDAGVAVRKQAVLAEKQRCVVAARVNGELALSVGNRDLGGVHERQKVGDEGAMGCGCMRGEYGMARAHAQRLRQTRAGVPFGPASLSMTMSSVTW